MGLRWPLSRGSQFKFHFTRGDGETEDRAKVSTSPLFEGLLINNTKLQDILARTRCMTIQIKPKELRQNWKSRIRMFRDYLINRLYLQKINLKRPLSRSSRFKIYFRLECWGNRGSRQNFHGIPFPKDRVFINPNHYVTLQIYYDHILI